MCERMVEGVEGLFPVGGFKLTFPDSNAMPSHVSKPFLLLNVPLSVAVYLPLPEVDICFRLASGTKERNRRKINGDRPE